MIERFEPRLCLHNAVLTDGLLTVRGEDVNDTFVFAVDTDLGLFKLQASENGEAESPQNYLIDRVRAVLVYGNGGADTIDATGISIPIAVDGGKGNDTLLGGKGNDTLKGGAAGDSIMGNDGNDVIVGGYGNDTLQGNKGSRDLVDYGERGGAVTAVIGHTGNGEAGENDNIATTFEIARGGAGNDTLGTSTSNSVTLIGGAGDDTLTGQAGNDALDGGPGTDLMIGNAGNDSFYARDGVIERLEGGTGTDVLISVDKKDKLFEIP